MQQGFCFENSIILVVWMSRIARIIILRFAFSSQFLTRPEVYYRREDIYAYKEKLEKKKNGNARNKITAKNRYFN